MSATLFLIGGFGFVGRNILDQVDNDLVHKQFFKTAIVDDLSNACPGHRTLDLPQIGVDYNAVEAQDFINTESTPNADRVFVFLAGETRVAESRERPADFIDANIVKPSQFVLNTIKPGDHFVLISTAGALFDGTFEIDEDSAYCPKNFYGATKAAEEMVLEKLVELRGGKFTVVRMTNVYGKFSDNKKSAIHAFTRAAIRGETVTLNGDGQQTRDFIYAGDVGRAIATLAHDLCNGVDTQVVNLIGSGESSSMMEVVDAVQNAACKPLNYVRDTAEDLMKTEPRDVSVAHTALTRALRNKITPLENGIAQTHKYYLG